MIRLYLVLLFYLWIQFLPGIQSAFADVTTVSVAGHYDPGNHSLTATAEYQFSDTAEIPKYFHLPPNWYGHYDQRTRYPLNLSNPDQGYIDRSQLDRLKRVTYQNLHFPRKITIDSVTLNDRPLGFQVIDNPLLNPSLNHRKGVLQLAQASSDGQPGHLVITFKTYFRAIPDDYNRILWNYIPRPVGSVGNRHDFADQYPTLLKISQKISGGRSTNSAALPNSSLFRTPAYQISDWDITTASFQLSLDAVYRDDAVFQSNRISRVLRFLKEEGWINPDAFFQFSVWDGPLSVAGNLVLLPRKVFRYARIYYRTFEVTILKGVLLSSINQRFAVDRLHHSWMLSALSSEAIRSYFKNVYRGDTKFFPWVSWLNPDFLEEETIKPWLTQQSLTSLTDATNSLNLRYNSTLYNPWHEKGSHFFRTVMDSATAIEPKLYPKLKDLFQGRAKVDQQLTESGFFNYFELSNDEIEVAERWLKATGKVDYDLADVEVELKDGMYTTTIQILNHGNLSPGFEVKYRFDDGTSVQQQISTGAGVYTVESKDKPIGIEIDPERYLLEDSRLNNRWQLPLKVRPIWDFPSAENWVFTFFPIINGNAIDQNLIGLSFNLYYLTNTVLIIDAWKSTESDKVLWEGLLVHNGFPGNGDVLYLQSSELNASYANTLGYRHTFLSINRNLSIELAVSNEKLDHLETTDLIGEFSTWNIGKITLSTPLYNGSFIDWLADFTLTGGEHTETSSVHYGQKSAATSLTWHLKPFKINTAFSYDVSQGTVPLQKRFSIGGPEGLPGFPRELDLLFDHRKVATLGIGLPPIMTHSNLNLFRLAWFNRVETAVNTHWGQGRNGDDDTEQEFRDVELRFDISVDWLNLYTSTGYFAIAAPIGSEEYRDYRLILFSNWVF